VPLRVPHVFYGNNFGARVASTQNARTVLTRAILDHAAITTTPRWGVLKGGLANPKEMQDNRLGGIVNLNRPDAVKALEYANLNPFVFQTLEMLKTNKEESTGISSLSQGLNKDAISTQNSAALVDNLVTLSQQRQKIIARNFANGFLVPLYLEVYRLVLENEKSQKIVEVAGNFVPVSTADWVQRKTCRVALHLGYGERDQQATKLSSTYMVLSKDPGVGPMFTPQNRYDMLMDTMRAGGLENAPKYLTPPQVAEPPKPDPLKVKELEIKDTQAQASMVSAQANALKSERQATVAALKENLQEAKLRTENVWRERENDRMDAETANRIDVSQREMELLESAPPTESTGITSPNS